MREKKKQLPASLGGPAAVNLLNFILYASIGIHCDSTRIQRFCFVADVRPRIENQIFDVLPAVESIYMPKQIIRVLCRRHCHRRRRNTHTVFIVANQKQSASTPLTTDNIKCVFALSCWQSSTCLHVSCVCALAHRHTPCAVWILIFRRRI